MTTFKREARARLKPLPLLADSLLGPEIQERILMGKARATERALRAVVGEPNWEKQLAAFAPTSKDMGA